MKRWVTITTMLHLLISKKHGWKKGHRFNMHFETRALTTDRRRFPLTLNILNPYRSLCSSLVPKKCECNIMRAAADTEPNPPGSTWYPLSRTGCLMRRQGRGQEPIKAGDAIVSVGHWGRMGRLKLVLSRPVRSFNNRYLLCLKAKASTCTLLLVFFFVFSEQKIQKFRTTKWKWHVK